jgi:predicted amidohydrolase YtcJ
VASYNPWVSLYWMVTGKTVGGVSCILTTTASVAKRPCGFTPKAAVGFRAKAARKGAIAAGQLADLVALTDDYFSVPEEKIKGIESVLTIVGGKIVHATKEFTPHAPPSIPVLPEWSPAKSLRRLRRAVGHS